MAEGSKSTELIICRGLQASGKTTWAHAWVAEDRRNRARINRDDLRTMLDNGTYEHGITEGRILVARDHSILGLLHRGISVVSDDTNLRAKNVKDLAKLAVKASTLHAPVGWGVMDFPVDLDECIRRNDLRNRRDGHKLDNEVIIDTYNRFLRGKEPLPIPDQDSLWGGDNPQVQPYEPPRGKPKAIIVDIDGTVALRGTRSPFDESRVNEDQPNIPVIKRVQAMAVQENYKIIFVSGRTGGCFQATAEWLGKYVGWFDALFMRPIGDGRKDSIVKAELFDKYIRDHYRVEYVFDDRNQVVDFWRSLGLTCFAVADGNF